MSELPAASLPETAPAGDPDAAAFRWPEPWPAARAAGDGGDEGPPHCEIEGHNGRQMRGRLLAFVPAEQLLRLQVPPARTPLAVRFEQFRSLALPALLQPLEPQPPARYRVTMRSGPDLEGRTLGHAETPFGLFLFPPAGGGSSPEEGRNAPPDGGVAATRLFVPRGSYLQAQVEPAEAGADAPADPRIATPARLLAALARQSRMPVVRLGEALVGLGMIDAAQLAEALALQKTRPGVPLGALLVQQGWVSPQDLQTALTHKMGYPLVDVARFPVDTEALRQVPYHVANRLAALPLLLHEGRLVVALEDPARRVAIEELEFASQLKVVPVLAQAGSLPEALREPYERLGADVGAPAAPLELEPGDTGRLVESLERDSAGGLPDEEDGQIEQSDNSLVRLIHNMILEAQARGVSDIHVECNPGRQKVRVRFRRDGLLQPYLELPHNYRSALVARLKIMGDLDISERRKPQDGKINFARFVPGHRLELRVATVPTHDGLEDVVLRLLSSARPLPLEQLGLSEHNLARLRGAVERPYGMVLCVGPTGSGKTTTLHSVLGHLNTPARKIWTAEDPVEITQPGLRQVQVNAKIGWSFAQALRSFLRADPDVIMVGEIRDPETARIAVEASLTGHLVLSTLHTNSAPETVTRLLDMGMDPFNFADSLLAVLGQRLVRRLCTHCRRSRPATDEEVDELLADWLQPCPKDDPRFEAGALRREWQQRLGRDGRLELHESPGCERCDHTGLRGRVGLHELLLASRELRHLIQTGAHPAQLLQQALREGLRTLRQDGIEKVLQGLTTLAEVRATSNA